MTMLKGHFCLINLPFKVYPTWLKDITEDNLCKVSSFLINDCTAWYIMFKSHILEIKVLDSRLVCLSALNFLCLLNSILWVLNYTHFVFS